MTTTGERGRPVGQANSQSCRPIIELNAVVREFPGAVPVRALAGVDLRIDRGEYVAVTGRSGSGKSTLLNVLGLLDRPTGGSYRVDGTDTAKLKSARVDRLRARTFGFVFQAFHLVDYLTTAENIELGLTYTPLAGRARRKRVAELLDRVELSHRRDARTATLSGGERQRVAIARALVHHPVVLLADEPTGNLDEETSWSVLSLFGEINTEGVTVIVVTHDQQTAACASRAVVIRDGTIATNDDQLPAPHSAGSTSVALPQLFEDPPTAVLPGFGLDPQAGRA